MGLDLNNINGLGTGLSGLSPLVGAATSLIPGSSSIGQLQDAGDINTLMGLVSESKNSLLRTSLLYVEMAALSLAFVTTSKLLKITGDANNTANAQNVKSISAEYVSVEKTALQNDKTNTDKQLQGQDPSTLFAKVQTAIDSYIKIEKPDDSDYEIPMSNDDGNDRGIFYGETDPTKPANGGVNNFPIFGTPFDNHSETISNNLNNLTIFETNDHNNVNQNKSMYKGWVVKTTDGKWVPDPIRTFTKATPFSDFISKAIKTEYSNASKQPPGTIKFFIEKLHGRYADGTPYKKGKIESQTEITGTNNYSNRLIFPAYIDNFNDSYSSSWSSYSFIGRGEDVPIYKSTKRTMSLSFSIIADYSIDLLTAMEEVYTQLGFTNIYDKQLEDILNSKQDWGLGYVGLPTYDSSGKIIGSHIPGKYSDTTETLWSKLTFLSQCMYPYYRSDGKMKEQPMIRLRLADFYDVVGYIESFSIDTSEFDNTIDLNPTVIGNIPFAAKVTLNMSVFHDNEPSSTFYGFYHRKEFDEGTMDPVTGENISTNPKGVVAAGTQKKSPLSFNSGVLNEKLTDTPSSLQNSDILKSSISDFNNKFTDLNKMGINLPDAIRKDKITKAMQAYVRVSDVANQLRAFYGMSQSTQTAGMPSDLSVYANTTKTGNSNASINNFGSVVDNSSANIANNQIAQDPLYGNNQSGLNSTKQSGILAVNQDVVKDAYNSAVNQVSGTSNSPKTINDILNNLNKA